MLLLVWCVAAGIIALQGALLQNLKIDICSRILHNGDEGKQQRRWRTEQFARQTLLPAHVALCQKEDSPQVRLMGKEKHMKHPQQITLAGTKTTVVEVCNWGQELERLHARIAQRFARPEPRRRALAYLQGIVSTIERKNSWQLAEHAGEGHPDGMQRFLNSAV